MWPGKSGRRQIIVSSTLVGMITSFTLQLGILFFLNKVFNNTDHDHFGIVLENYDDYIITAEGNVENVS